MRCHSMYLHHFYHLSPKNKSTTMPITGNCWDPNLYIPYLLIKYAILLAISQLSGSCMKSYGRVKSIIRAREQNSWGKNDIHTVAPFYESFGTDRFHFDLIDGLASCLHFNLSGLLVQPMWTTHPLPISWGTNNLKLKTLCSSNSLGKTGQNPKKPKSFKPPSNRARSFREAVLWTGMGYFWKSRSCRKSGRYS